MVFLTLTHPSNNIHIVLTDILWDKQRIPLKIEKKAQYHFMQKDEILAKNCCYFRTTLLEFPPYMYANFGKAKCSHKGNLGKGANYLGICNSK